jgi:hypothetical protein
MTPTPVINKIRHLKAKLKHLNGTFDWPNCHHVTTLKIGKSLLLLCLSSGAVAPFPIKPLKWTGYNFKNEIETC